MTKIVQDKKSTSMGETGLESFAGEKQANQLEAILEQMREECDQETFEYLARTQAAEEGE